MLQHTAIRFILIAHIGGLALRYVSSGSLESDNYVVNSGVINLCGIKCGAQLIYEVDHYATPVILGQSCDVKGHHRVPKLDVICDQDYWNPLGGRVTVDVNRGCCYIKNVTKSDSGIYTISLTGEDGKLRPLRCYKYQIIDPVTIYNISLQTNNLEEQISLSVSYGGDQPITIIWRKDGEDLPDGCMLTHSNQTLIVPYNTSGNFTVTIRNPISVEEKDYNVHAAKQALDWDRNHIAIAVAVVIVLCLILWVIYVLKRKGKWVSIIHRFANHRGQENEQLPY